MIILPADPNLQTSQYLSPPYGTINANAARSTPPRWFNSALDVNEMENLRRT